VTASFSLVGSIIGRSGPCMRIQKILRWLRISVRGLGNAKVRPEKFVSPSSIF